jgi:hypothetical protein
LGVHQTGSTVKTSAVGRALMLTSPTIGSCCTEEEVVTISDSGGVGAGLERLEGRLMLAAAPPILGVDGVLTVVGTPGEDRVNFQRAVANGKDEIRVKFNGQRFYFRTADVKRIVADLGAGDDRVEVDRDSAMIKKPLGLWGDGGDDSLAGAAGDDRLLGGDGDDSLVGGPGHDQFDGGDGDDTLMGGRGNDGLSGGAGDDALVDEIGENVFRGGMGNDDVRRGYALPPEFIIGVWGQPSNYAWRWKARGVNTMVAAELWGGIIPMSTWDNEVRANGMYMIRQPSAHPEDDGDYKNLIAWLANDEPDVHHTDPKQTSAVYAKLKKANPNLPVFMNFSGGHVVGYQETQWKHPYKEWLAGADWSSNDIYPVAGWNMPDRLWLVGQAIDKLRKLALEKPQFAFIETSDQGRSWNMAAPGPTPGQLRAEIWNAVIHGARGITYFADQFKPTFSYNATPPDVEAEMIAQNARLTALSPVLLAPHQPKGYSIRLPKGMEGTVRRYGGKTYLIVLNLNYKAVEDAEIKVGGVEDGVASVYGEDRGVPISGRKFTDRFEPLTPRVYVVG